MALLRYMRPVNGLPDPKDQFSLTLSSSSIAGANHLVQEVTKEAVKQAWTVQDLRPTVRSEIGKYACLPVVVNVVSMHA